MKFVVIIEIPNSGYMDCVGVYDNAEQAYGKAYLELSDGLDDEKYYITFPTEREGENGWMIECRSKKDDVLMYLATILFYRGDKDEQKTENDRCLSGDSKQGV